MEETFTRDWELGDTLLGVAGTWTSRVEKSGNDEMGRWSWVNLRGKQGRIIKVISAYRVSHVHTSQAGDLTSYKQ